MRDKRPVDEISTEELERILVMRKRQARMQRHIEGRRVMDLPPEPAEPEPEPEPEDVAVSTGTAAPPTLPTKYYDGTPAFEDELDARLSGRRIDPSAGVNWRRWWNRVLALVEVAAVLGLIGLVIALFQSFQAVNDKTAQIQAEAEATRRAAFIPPTPTAVINVGRVVLPGGHSFEGNNYTDSNAVFNVEEVPARYRDQFAAYQTQIVAARPTLNPEGPIRIQIASIKVDKVVVAGDDWEALKLGVGHLIGSANPGQRGNMVLAGHNDVFGEVFRDLDKIKVGDEIIVSTRTREYTYVVQPQQDGKAYLIVQPTDVWVTDAQGDVRQLTLVSCYPYRVDNRRIIIFATLKN